MNNNELYHYGIPGMRWGHRKSQPNTAASRRYQSSKLAYKQSKKEYNKAFNKATNYSSRRPISQFVGKKAKAESDKRWADAYDKAAKLNKDKADYKRAKKDYKQGIKRVGSQIGKDLSSSAKNKYNNMNAKSQKKLKKAARVGLVAFTPIGITAQLAAHGVNKHVKKHPETIQKGKNKINKLKKTTVSQAKKYADVWNQR